MNDKALAAILGVDVVGSLAWALVLALFVDWSTAWSIAFGSFVYAAVLLGALYQFAEVQAARKAKEQAEEDVDDPAPTKGVQ